MQLNSLRVSGGKLDQTKKLEKNANLWLTMAPGCGIIIDVAGDNTPGRHMEYAAVAHLVERHLAKVEVASSSLVGRSNTKPSSMRIAKMMAFLFDSRSGKVCRC